MSEYVIKGFNGKGPDAWTYGYLANPGERNTWVVRTPGREFYAVPGNCRSKAYEYCVKLAEGPK